MGSDYFFDFVLYAVEQETGLPPRFDNSGQTGAGHMSHAVAVTRH